jgi:hypothetical protein
MLTNGDKRFLKSTRTQYPHRSNESHLPLDTVVTRFFMMQNYPRASPRTIISLLCRKCCTTKRKLQQQFTLVLKEICYGDGSIDWNTGSFAPQNMMKGSFMMKFALVALGCGNPH